GGIRRDVRVADLYTSRDLQVPEPLRDLRVPHHPAPDERDLAIELHREVHENLHPVDAGGERRDDQPPGGAREDFLEGLDDIDLRSGEAPPVDVGAVGEERKHVRGAQLREAVDVEVLAVDRRLVDLEVARVDHDADRGMDGESNAIGDAVRDADEFNRERADG